MRKKSQKVMSNKVKMTFKLSNLETAIMVKFAYRQFNNVRELAIMISKSFLFARLT